MERKGYTSCQSSIFRSYAPVGSSFSSGGEVIMSSVGDAGLEFGGVKILYTTNKVLKGADSFTFSHPLRASHRQNQAAYRQYQSLGEF